MDVDYKLTIDIGLMHEKTIVPAMKTLTRWQEEGKVKLVEAEPPRGSAREPAYGWPGAPPRPDTFAIKTKRRGVKTESLNKSSFNSLAGILFPEKNYQKLNMSEINDVAHLVKHHGSKNELFVTGNLKIFIEGGKRERLKSGFGILTMTPTEAVEMLSKIEGWR